MGAPLPVQAFSQDAVDAFYTLIDVARVASQECQFIDGRSHTRTHDDENSHTTASDMDCGLACISRMPIGRMNVTIELSRTVKAIIPF